MHDRVTPVARVGAPSGRLLATIGVVTAVVIVAVLFRGSLLGLALGVGFVLLTLKFPELCFALLLTAGSYKEWLAPMLPLPFDFTVALTLLVGIAVLLRWGARSAARDETRPRSKVPVGLVVALTLLALTVVLSGLATDAIYGREKAARFLALTVTASVAAWAVLDSEARLRRFLGVTIALGLLMVVVGRVTSEGMVAMNATHIATGRILGLGIIGVLYFVLRTRRTAFRLLLLVPGVALGYGFFYSGSRGALVAMLAALAVTAITTLGMKRARRGIVVAAGTLALLAAAISVLVPQSVELMNKRMNQVSFDNPGMGVAGERVSLARDAWDIFVAHPLTGVGVGGFNLALGYADSARGVYPHNILLELASELGLAGVGAFLLLTILALRQIGLALRRGRFALVVLVIAIASYFLANAMFSGDLNDNRMLFMALGVCFALPSMAGGETGGREELPGTRRTVSPGEPASENKCETGRP
jgi:O-antigen ligase